MSVILRSRVRTTVGAFAFDLLVLLPNAGIIFCFLLPLKKEVFESKFACLAALASFNMDSGEVGD